MDLMAQADGRWTRILTGEQSIQPRVSDKVAMALQPVINFLRTRHGGNWLRELTLI